MSDDEADPELLALLRQHIHGKLPLSNEPETRVLQDAEYVYDNAIDVALDMRSCKNAAAHIYSKMQEKAYSPSTWSEHELHMNTCLLFHQPPRCVFKHLPRLFIPYIQRYINSSPDQRCYDFRALVRKETDIV